MASPEELLVDAEQRQAEHPDTFEIPDAELRSILDKGLLAKVILESNGAGERVWLKITRVDGDTYTGSCMNDPIFTTVVRKGTRIRFGARHIIDVDVPADWKG